MSETEQLEACDEWKVDPDDKPYQRMRDHAAEMERVRDAYKSTLAALIPYVLEDFQPGFCTRGYREAVENACHLLGIDPENDSSQAPRP